MAKTLSPSLGKLLHRSGLFVPALMWLLMSASVCATTIFNNPPPSLDEYIEILKAGEAQGTVIRKAVEEGPRGARQMVYYRFRTADGREIEKGAWAAREWWDRAEPGQTFTVYYLKSDPQKNRPMSTAGWENSWPLPVFSALALACGIVALLWSVHRALWQRRVYERGSEARGELVELSSRNDEPGGSAGFRVVYRFRDSGGAVRRGKGWWMTEEEAKRWRNFAGIRVRYDRYNSAHHVLVDDPRPFA